MPRSGSAFDWSKDHDRRTGLRRLRHGAAPLPTRGRARPQSFASRRRLLVALGPTEEERGRLSVGHEIRTRLAVACSRGEIRFSPAESVLALLPRRGPRRSPRGRTGRPRRVGMKSRPRPRPNRRGRLAAHSPPRAPRPRRRPARQCGSREARDGPARGGRRSAHRREGVRRCEQNEP